MVDRRALLEAVLEARVEVDDAEARFEAAKEKKTEAERKLIEHMEQTDERSFKADSPHGIVSVSIVQKLYTSVEKDDKDTLLKWVDEECGRPDIIKRDIHPQTLTSFISQRIEKGEPVPSFIQMFFKNYLRVSNSK